MRPKKTIKTVIPPLPAVREIRDPETVRRIAHSNLPDPEDPRYALCAAIVASPWCSLRGYTMYRLGLPGTPQAMGRWIFGIRRVPAAVAAQVAADFPHITCHWASIAPPIAPPLDRPTKKK